MFRILGAPLHGGTGTFPAKAYEVIALAALYPGQSISRAETAALLWDGTVAKDAFGNLRYVLNALRTWERRNDLTLVSTTAGRIALAPAAQDAVDAGWAMQLDAVSSDGTMAILLDAYRGDLLEGIETATPEMLDWLAGERNRLSLKFASLVLNATNLSADVRITALRRLQELNPFDEATAREYMLALHSAGHGHLARSVMQRFQRALRDELGVEVGFETQLINAQLFGAASAAVATDPGRKDDPPPDHVGVAASASTLPRVLVLPPFRSRPGLNAELVLARAMTSEVILDLGSMRTFALIAPHTARQADFANPMSEGMRLGADYVVSTQVLPPVGGQRLGRLGFALTQVTTQDILVADVLPFSQHHLESSGADLAGAIAAAVSGGIEDTELSRFRRTGAASAYVHYLLGQERMGWDLRSVRKARKHFRRAADMRRQFSNAHAMVARTLSNEWLLLGRNERDLLIEAEAIARQAISMDPLGVYGHWELATASLYQQQVDESLYYVEKALGRAPYIADLKCDHADVLVHTGDAHAAKRAITEALALNPLAPDDYFWVKGSAEFMLENFHDAVSSLSRMKDQMPVARLMASCFAMMGDMRKAGHYRALWMERYPDFLIADWVKVIPMRNPAIIELMTEGMRKAGFA